MGVGEGYRLMSLSALQAGGRGMAIVPVNVAMEEVFVLLWGSRTPGGHSDLVVCEGATEFPGCFPQFQVSGVISRSSMFPDLPLTIQTVSPLIWSHSINIGMVVHPFLPFWSGVHFRLLFPIRHHQLS